MKIRLTILTENNIPYNNQIDPETVRQAWQTLLDTICKMAPNEDKAIVERVDISE